MPGLSLPRVDGPRPGASNARDGPASPAFVRPALPAGGAGAVPHAECRRAPAADGRARHRADLGDDRRAGGDVACARAFAAAFTPGLAAALDRAPARAAA